MMHEWQEEMATGNVDIDRQHRDLLKKVNDLLIACRERRMKEEVSRLFWFLKRYVRRHFRDEEKLQRESGFPGYPPHKAQHDAFYREVQCLEAQYLQEGASTMLIVQSVHMMSSWMHTHFNHTDRMLVEYLHSVDSKYGPK